MLEIIAEILKQVNKMMTNNGFFRTAVFVIVAILSYRLPDILQVILNQS